VAHLMEQVVHHSGREQRGPRPPRRRQVEHENDNRVLVRVVAFQPSSLESAAGYNSF
jgi:hypothetical protein